MARPPFNAEVLTPEGQVFEGEVEMVSTRTTVGSLAVLAHHQPMLTLLEPTELRLYEGENDPRPDRTGRAPSGGENATRRYAQGEGYMQVTGESVLLLVEEAIPPGDLDAADLRDRLRPAQEGG